MNRNLVNSKLDKYRERGKVTYTFCQVGCDCNIAVNLLEKCENLQSKIDKAIDKLESLLPMCIMPNNMLIHGTEKAKAIEETLDILKEDNNEQ